MIGNNIVCRRTRFQQNCRTVRKYIKGVKQHITNSHGLISALLYVIKSLIIKVNWMLLIVGSRLSRIALMILCSELSVLNEEEYFCRHKAFWNSIAIIILVCFIIIIIIITDLLWRRSTGAQQRLTKCA